MVTRVALFLSILILAIGTTPAPNASAGPPPYAPPPSCAPPPCPTYAPPCGPPAPAAICGGLLGACSNVCGLALGCPSAIMKILLAPPPPLPRAPRCCCPRCTAPPMYCRSWVPPPCPPPQRIQKCRTAPPRPYRPMSYVPTGPTPAPMVCPPEGPCMPAFPALGRSWTNLSEKPFVMAAGALSAPESASGMAFADRSAAGGNPTLGRHW